MDHYVHTDAFVTPMTQMIDSAVDNLTWGTEYLEDHPVHE